MSSSTLQAEVFIDETNDGKASSGYLEIVSSEDITIDAIQGEIHFEARGRMQAYEKIIATFSIISQPTQINAHEETLLPFTFEMNDGIIESYEGRNVSFKYRCEVSVDVNRDDFKKLGLSFLSNIKSLITSNRTLRTLKDFEIRDLKHTYAVNTETLDFKLQGNYTIPIVLSLLLFMVYVLFIPEFDTGLIVFGIVMMLGVSFFSHYYLKQTLGKVTMDISDADDGFLCVIGKTKKFNLSDQSLYYEVIEEVVDSRGTKTSRSREVVYKSERKAIHNFKKHLEFKFLYPERLCFESNKTNDVTILWQMKITGKSNVGLILNYTCEFRVRKDKPMDEAGLVTY